MKIEQTMNFIIVCVNGDCAMSNAKLDFEDLIAFVGVLSFAILIWSFAGFMS